MKRTRYKKGDWNVIEDVGGKKVKASQTQRRWDGMRVLKNDFEERHPQDFQRAVPDDPSVPWTRSDGSEDDITSEGDTSPTLTVGTDDPLIYFTTALTANRTITLDTTGAIEGDKFVISRSDGAAFTLDVGGLQTIPASLDAVVTVEYNGSAWQLIDYTLTET